MSLTLKATNFIPWSPNGSQLLCNCPVLRCANSLCNGVGINMYSWNAQVVKKGQTNGLKKLTTIKIHVVIIFEYIFRFISREANLEKSQPNFKQFIEKGSKVES